MTKKRSFKSLPKKAQRAAFAQMDDDGTRRGGKQHHSFAEKEILKGFRIGPGGASGDTVRVVSPKTGMVGIAKRGGRSNQQIIAALKKGNKSFR